MKRFLLAVLTLLFSISLWSQDYVTQQIGYNPPHSFAEIPTSLTSDDIFSDVIDLGFDFEFYGVTYDQVVIGTNGVIAFNTGLANSACAWSFDENIPDPNFPFTNVILCPYQDYDPSVTGEFNYAQYGTAPNRRFVLNIYEVPLFSSPCNVIFNTVQVVLYETTNDIDFYMQDKFACASWNDGNAVLGIVNANGTEALAAEGRNTSDSPWEANLEAWRFSYFTGTTVEAYNTNFEICDSGNGGFEEFDLSLIETLVAANQSDVEVSYHITFLDANNDVNPLANPYTNTSNPETIYARVENTQGLYATSEVTLAVIACVDEDNDGVSTEMEDLNGDGFPGNDDTDNDGIPNYLDPDDDNDWVQTSDEITGIGAGAQGGYDYIDTDNDGIENYLDNDDDADGLTTTDEDYNGNGDPIDDDTDNDGIPEFLDNEFLLSTNDLTDSEIYLAPNPFKNSIELVGNFNHVEVEITVYTVNGRQVYFQRHLPSNGTIVLDGTEFTSGLYFLRIAMNDQVVIKRIIKN